MDFGSSFYRSTVGIDYPVWDSIKAKFPVTFELTILSLVMSFAVAIPLGVVSALYQDRPLDYASRIITIIGICPAQLLGGHHDALHTVLLFQLASTGGLRRFPGRAVGQSAANVFPSLGLGRVPHGLCGQSHPFVNPGGVPRGLYPDSPGQGPWRDHCHQPGTLSRTRCCL